MHNQFLLNSALLQDILLQIFASTPVLTENFMYAVIEQKYQLRHHQPLDLQYLRCGNCAFKCHQNKPNHIWIFTFLTMRLKIAFVMQNIYRYKFGGRHKSSPSVTN